jgi:hypothetical protein
MRTITRWGLGIALLVAVVLGWRLGSARASAGVPIRAEILAYEADADQVQMVRWAANRFEVGGLPVPEVEIHFHRDLSGCGGYLGYALGGRVDLCTDVVDTPARRALLHEMGHIWLDEHFPASKRPPFLRLRNLAAWNASDDPWNVRGYEQGAEVMAWALGERIMTPSMMDNGEGKLEIAYSFLTGQDAPDPP